MKIQKVSIPKLGLVPSIRVGAVHYPAVKVTTLRIGDSIIVPKFAPPTSAAVHDVQRRAAKMHVHIMHPVHLAIRVHVFGVGDWVPVTHATYRKHHPNPKISRPRTQHTMKHGNQKITANAHAVQIQKVKKVSVTTTVPKIPIPNLHRVGG